MSVLSKNICLLLTV